MACCFSGEVVTPWMPPCAAVIVGGNSAVTGTVGNWGR
jgi:hypothetical protein